MAGKPSSEERMIEIVSHDDILRRLWAQMLFLEEHTASGEKQVRVCHPGRCDMALVRM